MSKKEILMEISRLKRRIDVLILLESDAWEYGPFEVAGMFTNRICDYELEIFSLEQKLRFL